MAKVEGKFNNNIFVVNMADQDPAVSDLLKRLKSFGYVCMPIEKNNDITFGNGVAKTKLAILKISSDSSNDQNLELIQKLKKYHPDIKILAVFSRKIESDQAVFLDSGVDYIYQYPFEDELLINTVFEICPIDLGDRNLSIDILARVNITDIKAGDQLPFSLYVFLPANEKIIPYNKKDQPLDSQVVSKFSEHSHYNLYIKKSELKDYLDYCAKGLTELSAANMDHRKKQKAINNELKSLMGGFFTSTEGDEKDQNQIIDNLGKVLSHLDDASGDKEDLVKTVEHVASQQLTNFTHSRNVATYCALFGMSVGINEPQSLRMGGLLHDLGMSDLTSNLLTKDFNKMSEDEQAQFKLHPGNAKLTLMSKGVNLPKFVMNMITQHHELPDGSGFPYGLKSQEIDPFAKICAFADVFDTLTSVREGYVQLSPEKAMIKIAGLDGAQPDLIFEEEFHLPIIVDFLGKKRFDEIVNENKPSHLSQFEAEQSDIGVAINSSKDRDYGDTHEAAAVDGNGNGNGRIELGLADDIEEVASRILETSEELEKPLGEVSKLSGDELGVSSTEVRDTESQDSGDLILDGNDDDDEWEYYDDDELEGYGGVQIQSGKAPSEEVIKKSKKKRKKKKAS
ncbi:MAG: HD-GYP domain-containing protein [Bdellovibrionales bacterium]